MNGGNFQRSEPAGCSKLQRIPKERQHFITLKQNMACKLTLSSTTSEPSPQGCSEVRVPVVANLSLLKERHGGAR
jgi:hypothetical protein